MKNNKKALLVSALAILLCCSILAGMTFAWFTDSAKAKKNIQAGNLDVEMYWTNDLITGAWYNAGNESEGVPFNETNWEPGYTAVRYVKIVNEGDLALKYALTLNALGEVGKLAEVIGVYYSTDVTANVADRSLTGMKSLGYLNTAVNGGTAAYGELAANGSVIVAVALKMDESAGNEYKNETVGAGFIFNLIAAQDAAEIDGFSYDYDINAESEVFPGFQGGAAGTVVALDDQNKTTSQYTVSGGDVSAVIPAGVKLADGASTLKLVVTLKNTTDSNVTLSGTEEMRPVDVHIEGVAQDNTTPMFVTLKQYLTTGFNTGALRLYHVENGATVAMTQVATPVNHNEFSYDPLTGDVTLALASFSEVAVIADTTNTWNGTAANAFAGGSGTEAAPYQIANADQLAYFRNEVDGGRTFDNEFVKLTYDIHLSKVNFDPIGWGYVNTDHNRDGADGKVFQGTFDGNEKTIFDLYQNGWDLESATETDYTYTNCGFGLFAAASGATFKNLTIYGASVTVECVEAGVLVGLSQNNCTYDNISIHNSKIANYQRPAGGLIGEVSGDGTTTITNVIIGSDVVVGSLWGDFDAPCGGVVGARWDDANADPKINMTNVEVGARMDVYSDVTSAYQWYAYRRAGMLIGNTEQVADDNAHLAAAKFLNCENVKIYYGNWAAYHYCQFTNQDNTWCNNYPWVRVEAGENCSPYSNPRYGQPVVGGVTVSTDDHTCCTGGNHMTELRFNQLYGGGQGVYGQPVHDGVEVINYRYSITYVNDYQVLAIKYVTETGAVSTANDAAQDLVVKWANVNIGEGKFAFGGWMNAGSTKMTEIPADNTKDIVLYPYFNNPYTARFVDQKGNVLAYCFFHKEDLTKLESTRATAEAALPDVGEDLEFDYWEVHITDNDGNITSKEDYNKDAFAGYTKDVTIYPVYLFKGDVNLVPVDSDSDGIIDYYQVAGYSDPNGQAMVEIPASVNGIPILEINKNAFSSYKGVHSIVVPNGVTIHKNAFCEGDSFGSGEEITIYFEGTKDQWNELTKETGWNYGIGTGSRVFFLKDGKVDTAEGYLEVIKSGGFLGIGAKAEWSEKDDFDSVKDIYTGTCNCSISTTGDTAHTYVDINGNVMDHNEDGTPVNSSGTAINFEDGGWFGDDKLTDGTNTYYRYRPDAAYWEGV